MGKKGVSQAEKPKVGRPSLYEPDHHPKMVTPLAAKGFTDEDIAGVFGISVHTVWDWRKKHVEFAKALKEGKHIANQRVEKSLYQRACGFQTEDKEVSVDAQGRKRVKVVTKQLAPETTACIFWLKNRRPDLWRDVWHHEHSGPDGGPIQHQLLLNKEALAKLSDKDLDTLMDIGFKLTPEGDAEMTTMEGNEHPG